MITCLATHRNNVKEIDLQAKSMKDVLAFGLDYTLIWCFVYPTDDEKENSKLIHQLRAFAFDDVPTCLIFLRTTENPWLPSGMPYYTTIPVLLPFCGGFAVKLVSSEDQFHEAAVLSLGMAKQLVEFKREHPNPLV